MAQGRQQGEFARAWNLELPGYLARLVVPLFDLDNPRRTTGLTTVYSPAGAAVGMLTVYERADAENGAARATSILTASVRPGIVAVANHTHIVYPDSGAAPCRDICERSFIRPDGIMVHTAGTKQSYVLDMARPRTAPAEVQAGIIASLERLNAAGPEDDIFLRTPRVDGELSKPETAIAVKMDGGHAFEPPVLAARADMIRIH